MWFKTAMPGNHAIDSVTLDCKEKKSGFGKVVDLIFVGKPD
jgi:hypothetical protein